MLDQVKAWAGFNWSANDNPRVSDPSMEIKPLDFNATGPSGKCAKMKQQYCIHLELLYAILNNIIEENDLDLILNESEDYTFEDPLNGDQKCNGVILLFKILFKT